MACKNAIYKCNDCGAQFEAVVPCKCEDCAISCCGNAMEVLEANTVDAATEKHVPVIEKTHCGWKVAVGSVAICTACGRRVRDDQRQDPGSSQ